MKYRFGKKTKRAGIALAAASALSLLGIGVALAQTFTSVDFSIEPRTNESKEVSAGDLTCAFREAGLFPYQAVTYNCAAQAVGIVEACVYKNKIISPTQLDILHDVSNVEGGHGGEALIANNQGKISGSVTTSPEAGEGGEGLCPELGEVNGPEPEVEAVAVRYCNMSLTDTTNNIVGGTQSELFAVLVNGNYTVPDCATLIASPPTGGGGEGGGGG